MIEYKGYTPTITADGEILHGEVAGIRAVVTFQGRTMDELIAAFRDSVDDYLEFCAERGKEPDRPYSGDISIRTEPELHRRIAECAAAEGKTMDEWIAGILERAAAEGGADQRTAGRSN